MVNVASCYRLGDCYDDVLVQPADEIDEADWGWDNDWGSYSSEEDDLTQWAERYTVPAYFIELSYEYVCPPDFRFSVD